MRNKQESDIKLPSKRYFRFFFRRVFLRENDAKINTKYQIASKYLKYVYMWIYISDDIIII